MSKSRGNLVFVSRLRATASTRWRSGWPALRALPHRPAQRDDMPAGPDAADVVARVRQYLADDLDTPKALAALDGWATDALKYGGHDSEAPQTVARCDRRAAGSGAVTPCRERVVPP
jgi:L-cysteine:1D-myo-inositol 2-amino-2-deoxy-alpha-D-glucopyranoside ligase